jgi:hypothetical protein
MAAIRQMKDLVEKMALYGDRAGRMGLISISIFVNASD